MVVWCMAARPPQLVALLITVERTLPGPYISNIARINSKNSRFGPALPTRAPTVDASSNFRPLDLFSTPVSIKQTFLTCSNQRTSFRIGRCKKKLKIHNTTAHLTLCYNSDVIRNEVLPVSMENKAAPKGGTFWGAASRRWERIKISVVIVNLKYLNSFFNGPRSFIDLCECIIITLIETCNINIFLNIYMSIRDFFVWIFFIEGVAFWT